MQQNIIPEIENLINSSTLPIVMLLVSDDCEHTPTTTETTVENTILNHTVKVSYYKWCVAEENMVFPRTHTPAVYFFLPQNQQVQFWREGVQLIHTLDKDLHTIQKMFEGKTYDEARYTESELTEIRLVDTLLSKETSQLDREPPSAMKSARLTSMKSWKTAKRSGLNLPILAPYATAKKRLKICEGCPLLDKEKYSCQKCGCGIYHKVQLANFECPEQKWVKFSHTPVTKTRKKRKKGS